MADILSAKLILRELLSEYAEKKDRVEREADQVRRRIAEKVPVYGDLSGTITSLFMQTGQRVAASPENAQEIIAKSQRDLMTLKQQVESALRENGFTPDMLEPKYACKLCKDTGFVGEPVHEHCACLKSALHRRLYDRAGIEDQNFSRFDLSIFSDEELPGAQTSQRALMEKNRAFCERFADGDPGVSVKNLLMVGPSGLGKTFLLNCVYARLLERGVPAIRVTAFRMLEIMRKAHRGQDEGELGQLMSVDVLMIDDLGSEPMFENITVEYLFNLLNERKQARLSTLIATNLTLRELQARYTERTLSRIVDAQDTAILRFAGRDVRMSKKA